MTSLEVLTDSFPDEPVRDMALSHAILRQVAAGERRPTLRVYRPAATVAFGRLDARLDGYGAAVELARRRGFAPVLRLTGGQAAAYDEQSLVVEEFSLRRDPAAGLHERFDAGARLLADALRTLGLDARVGRLPGEYCPGDHSVNLAGRLKVAGAAQRIVRGAALLSAVVVAGSGARIRSVLVEVYESLGRPMDPATAGAIGDVAPAVGTEEVSAAVLAAYGARGELTPGRADARLLGQAAELMSRHAVSM